MYDYDIVDGIFYLTVDSELDVIEFFQSREATKLLDKHPNIKVDIVYKDEVH